LPWWGPVLAPISIALLMLLWGTLASTWRVSLAHNSEWKAWVLNILGVSLALYLFMADSIRVAGRGVSVLREVRPASFDWPLFSIALFLMAAPIIKVLLRLRRQRLGAAPALDSERWIGHFVRNQDHRPEPDWNVPIALQRRIHF